jgi:hypothetical protein
MADALRQIAVGGLFADVVPFVVAVAFGGVERVSVGWQGETRRAVGGIPLCCGRRRKRGELQKKLDWFAALALLSMTRMATTSRQR